MFCGYDEPMKKILIIYWIIIFAWILLAFSAVAANAKKPSFFVPEGSFTASEEKPKISAVINRHAGLAASRNTKSTHSTPYKRLFNARKMNIEAAPIDEIAKVNHLSPTYVNSIIKSFTLTETQLTKLLKDEFERINNDTTQIHQIVRQWPNQSKAYHLANYMIKDQSGQEMIKSRQQIKDIKNKYQQLLASAGGGGRIYIIEAKDPLLYLSTVSFGVKGHLENITYISVFDNQKKHVFSYNRLHQDMLKDKQIPKIQQYEYEIYYQSFDDYLTDLKRIGQGLDVTNPTLLQQIGEMEDVVILQ